MKLRAASWALVLLAILYSCGGRDAQIPAQPVSDLVVYSSHPTEMGRVIVREFRDRTGLRVRMEFGGTGELLGRLRMERAQPHADLLWGGGAESLAANADLFEPYISPEARAVPPGLKDPGGVWTGFTVLPMILFVNGRLLSESKVPRSWADLGSEAFRGSIAFADPSVSGSAYTILRTMLQAGGGGEAGWSSVEGFVRNLEASVLPESALVFRSVASGEYLVGLSFENAAMDAGRTGSDVQVVYPEDGTSAVPDAVAIVRGAAHGPAARAFVDFVLGPDVAAIVVGRFGRRSARSGAPSPVGLPPLESLKLVPYDVSRAASERLPTIARFRGLLESGSRP